MSNADIAAAIRRKRLGRGWSQARLAQALHVSRGQVNRWESGAITPSMLNRFKLKEVLGGTWPRSMNDLW